MRNFDKLVLNCRFFILEVRWCLTFVIVFIRFQYKLLNFFKVSPFKDEDISLDYPKN